MKLIWLSIVFFVTSLQPVLSQTPKFSDTLFNFNKRYFQCENKWVVFPNSDKSYSYGFIYLDDMAGFTFDLQGSFKMDSAKIESDTSMRKTSTYKIRLNRNAKKVSLLPKELFKYFNITGEPDWLKVYNEYTDTLAHLIKRGYLYNGFNECAIALTYLEKAQQIDQHAKGLEYELAFAYNVLKRYDEAIAVLNAAISNDPKNIMFYRELGYSYSKKQHFEQATLIYQKAIAQCSDKELESKSEMAINLAQVYKQQGNAELYKQWALKAKEWAPKDSKIYNLLKDLNP